MILLLFWTLAIVGCGVAAVCGGRDGRWAAVLILCASVMSVPAILLGRHWLHTETGLLAVDVLLLAALYILTLTSRHYYPIWMTGFQLVAVSTHVSTLIAPDLTPHIYQAAEQFWAVPIILSMMMGVLVDLRGRRTMSSGRQT